jgi:predicted transcriptional regulator
MDNGKAQGRPLRDLVAEVAAAYLNKAEVGVAEIPQVIDLIWRSLGAIPPPAPAISSAPASPGRRPRPTPEQVLASITPEALISFEDGRRYQLLARHLLRRGLTPQQYREKWGLPADYPMIAPTLRAQRSEIAKRRLRVPAPVEHVS